MRATPSARSERHAFPSTLDAVGDLLAWFLALRPAEVPDALWIQGQTALMEGFSNAVRHAHAGLDAPPPVIVHLELTAAGLEIRIEDHGPPFALEEQLIDPLEAGVDGTDLPQREEHWGLLMLARLRNRFGWRIAYRPREGGGNVLCLGHDLSVAGVDQEP